MACEGCGGRATTLPAPPCQVFVWRYGELAVEVRLVGVVTAEYVPIMRSYFDLLAAAMTPSDGARNAS